MNNTWVFLLNMPLDILLLTWWFGKVLTPRFPARKNAFLLSTLVIVSTVIIYFLCLSRPSMLRAVLGLGTTIIYINLLFTDAFSYRMLCCGLYFFALETLDSLAPLVISVATGIPIWNLFDSNLRRLVILTFFYSVFLIYLQFLTPFMRRTMFRVPKNELFPLLLLPVSETILVLCTTFCVQIVNLNYLYIALLISTFTATATVPLLFHAIRKMLSSSEERHQAQMLKQQAYIQMEHYAALNEQINDTRKLRHDIKNHMEALRLLLQQKYYNEASQYFQQIYREFEEIPQTLYCKNHIANAVLYNKISYAHANQIDTTVKIGLEENCWIAMVDWVSLVTNLLDNAIEGCMKVPEAQRTLSISDHIEGDLYVLKVSNSKPAWPVITENEGLKTTKSHPESHGYGNKIISAIAQKYDGSVRFSDQNGTFSVVAMLRNVTNRCSVKNAPAKI